MFIGNAFSGRWGKGSEGRPVALVQATEETKTWIRVAMMERA